MLEHENLPYSAITLISDQVFPPSALVFKTTLEGSQSPPPPLRPSAKAKILLFLVIIKDGILKTKYPEFFWFKNYLRLEKTDFL